MRVERIKSAEKIIGKRFGEGILTKSQYLLATLCREQIKAELTALKIGYSNPLFRARNNSKVNELLDIQKLIEKELSLFEEAHIDEPDLVLFIMRKGA